MEVFPIAHHNYDYDKLCLEMNNLLMHENESIEEFSSRFMFLCCRFHPEDLPSEKYLLEWFSFLVLSNYKHNETRDEEHNIDISQGVQDSDSMVNLIPILNSSQAIIEPETDPQPHMLRVFISHFQQSKNNSDINIQSKNIPEIPLDVGCEENSLEINLIEEKDSISRHVNNDSSLHDNLELVSI